MKTDPPRPGDHELDKARALATYVDALAAGDVASAKEFAAKNPDMAALVWLELDALDDVSAILDGKASPATLGDFQVLRELKRGQLGIEVEALWLSRGRLVVLKLLPANLIADDETKARFRRGATDASGLRHRNIVELVDSGIDQGVPHVAYERVEGVKLEGIRRRFRAASNLEGAPDEDPEQALRAQFDLLLSTLLKGTACENGDTSRASPGEIRHPTTLQELSRVCCIEIARAFAGAAQGLEHAHSRGIVHGSLRPSKLLLDGRGDLRILDFGLGWAEDYLGRRGSGPLYTSPEQARGRAEVVGPATDIYSLGVSLYATLALGPVFEPAIPVELRAILSKCVREDPRERYPSAGALAEELCAFFRRAHEGG